MRLLSCFFAFACAGRALAGPDAPPAADRLRACEGLDGQRPFQRVDAVGDTAFHIAGPRGRTLVILVAGDGGERCEVYPIGRALDRVHGHFLSRLQDDKAFLLTPKRCDGESCPLAVALRGKADVPLAVLRVADPCDRGATLQTLRLFPDRDSLEIACRASSGAGYAEQRLVVHAVGAAPSVVLAMSAGAHEDLAPDERKRGACASFPAGFIKVEKRGAAPVLRVLEPRAEDMKAGAGTSPAWDWTFDPAARKFIRGATAIPTAFSTFGNCKPR